MPLITEGEDLIFDALNNLLSLALENTQSAGADEAGIAKYFLASLEIHGKRELCNFHHASGSIGEVAEGLTTP